MPYRYSRVKIWFSYFFEFTFFILFYILGYYREQKKIKKNGNENQILLIEPFQMGDAISLSVLFDPILNRFVNAKIYLLLRPSNKAVYEIDNRVTKVFFVDFPWADYNKKFSIKKIFQLILDLYKIQKSYTFEIGIDPRGDIRSQIILAFLKCKKRIGYLTYLNSNIKVKGLLLTHKLNASKYNHRFESNYELLGLLGINNQLPIDFPTLQVPAINMNRTIHLDNANKWSIVIHTEAGWKAKKWPDKNWEELIHFLIAENRSNITIISHDENSELLIKLKAIFSKYDNFTIKKTNYLEMVNIINSSNLFICLDSGPMNIGGCLKKNVIALFGPGDSINWYPYGNKSFFIHNIEKFKCSPCFQTKCFFPENNCMMSIKVNDVIKVYKNWQLLMSATDKN